MPRLVAVTGASGFVGTWVSRVAAAAPWAGALTVVPFFPEGSRGLDDHAGLEAIVQALQPAAVIHLAGVAGSGEAGQDPRRAVEVNLTGTMMLAEAMLRHAPAARLIFAGSSEAYGRSFNAAAIPLTEEAAFAPATLYGVTKAATDLLLAQMAGRGLDVVRFRPFNHTGPEQTDAYAVPSFARQIARIEAGLQPPEILVGNLEAERDFLDVRDVATAYLAAAARPDPLAPATALNLASGHARSMRSILDDLLGMTTVPIAVRPDAARLRPSETPRAAGDARKAHDLLGWSPSIPLSTTLRDVLAYWREAVRQV